MNENIIVAACGVVLVMLAAIASNTFWIHRSLGGVEKRLGVIETELKQFFSVQSTRGKEIQRLKDKSNLQ